MISAALRRWRENHADLARIVADGGRISFRNHTDGDVQDTAWPRSVMTVDDGGGETNAVVPFRYTERITVPIEEDVAVLSMYVDRIIEALSGKPYLMTAPDVVIHRHARVAVTYETDQACRSADIEWAGEASWRPA